MVKDRTYTVTMKQIERLNEIHEDLGMDYYTKKQIADKLKYVIEDITAFEVYQFEANQ